VKVNKNRSFFNAIPLPLAALRVEGETYIVEEVNDAYLKLTDSKREDLLGSHIFDLYPISGDEEAAKGQRNLQASFKKVIETGKPDLVDVMRYDIKNQDTAKFEERYWVPENIPITEDGRVTHILHSVREKTHEIQAKKKERETWDKYQKLLQSVNVIVWEAHVGDFRHTYVSPQSEDILGYKAEEWFMEDDFWSNHIHPEDREKTVRYCREMSESGQDHDLEYRMIAADGREVWIKDIVTVNDGEDGDRYIRGVMIDITHQKLLEKDLNNLLGQLQERVKEQECLYKITELGLKGFPVDKILMKAAVYIKHGFQYPLITEVSITLGNETYQTRNYRETEWKLSNSSALTDGTLLRMDVCYQKEVLVENDTPFLSEEDVMLSVAVKTLAASIDKQKAFNKLKSLNRNLEWKTKELKRSNKELEEFAFATSNELQEPLRMINSFLKQLERKYGDQLDDKARQYIKFSVEGAKRMREVILDLLEFSRMGDTGKDPEPVDLNKLLEEVKLQIKRKVEQKNASIKADLLPVIHGFRDELKVLIQNLLENAITYHKENLAPEVVIHSEERDMEWIVHVSDSGLGIHPDYHDKIFNVFHRLHSYEEKSGTGIGLPICKKIAMMHGGEIWVKSEEGSGSTFSFSVTK
jgi:PAS domain S-box-containing protein